MMKAKKTKPFQQLSQKVSSLTTRQQKALKGGDSSIEKIELACEKIETVM